jgi:hypothetical protein
MRGIFCFKIACLCNTWYHKLHQRHTPPFFSASLHPFITRHLHDDGLTCLHYIITKLFQVNEGAAMKHKAAISFAGLVIAAVVVVMGLSVLTRSTSSSETERIDQPAIAQAASAPVATDDLRMHRVVQQGPFTTLVLSLRNYCGKLRKTSPDPEKQFISVELVIGNLSGQLLPLALRDVELVTENDSAYPLTQSECPPAFTAAQIQANGLVRGQLMFDIPAGESPKLLRYTLDNTVVIAGLRY